MQRFGPCGLLVLTLAACGDDGGEDDSTTTVDATSGGTTASGATASTTSDATGSGTTSSSTSASSTTDDPSTTAAGSTGEGGGSSSGDASTGGAGITFAEIQVDLQEQGCLTGGPCHTNPARNVVLVEDPDPTQLMQNWQNIHDAPGTPWVTPLDDTAQMLNEVPIPDDVRARWLQWILNGAPF